MCISSKRKYMYVYIFVYFESCAGIFLLRFMMPPFATPLFPSLSTRVEAPDEATLSKSIARGYCLRRGSYI